VGDQFIQRHNPKTSVRFRLLARDTAQRTPFGRWNNPSKRELQVKDKFELSMNAYVKIGKPFNILKRDISIKKPRYAGFLGDTGLEPVTSCL
jgi:hypothetical protein